MLFYYCIDYLLTRYVVYLISITLTLSPSPAVSLEGFGWKVQWSLYEIWGGDRQDLTSSDPNSSDNSPSKAQSIPILLEPSDTSSSSYMTAPNKDSDPMSQQNTLSPEHEPSEPPTTQPDPTLCPKYNLLGHYQLECIFKPEKVIQGFWYQHLKVIGHAGKSLQQIIDEKAGSSHHNPIDVDQIHTKSPSGILQVCNSRSNPSYARIIQ